MSTVLERKAVQVDGGVVLEKAMHCGHEELLEEAVRITASRQYGFDSIDGYRVSKPFVRVTRADLEKTLAGLDIEPYTEESVVKYKKKFDRKLLLRSLPAHVAEVFVPIALVVGGLCLAIWSAVVSVAILLQANIVVGGTVATSIGWAGISFLGLIISGILVVVAADSGKIKKKVAEWRLHDFTSYTLRTVPDFVLQTIVDLEKHCPNLDFRFDECTVNAVQVDPFLVVICEGRKYYLEVWNEPGFEK